MKLVEEALMAYKREIFKQIRIYLDRGIKSITTETELRNLMDFLEEKSDTLGDINRLIVIEEKKK